jgi:recombinational DNA repair ATPase RecF
MTKPIVPIIHLNGSGKQNLMEARQGLCHALREAERALREMAPNGRDYYPVDGLFEKAVAQHRQRQQTLQRLLAEIEAEMEMIDAV